MTGFDVVVVGGGPAGITAAVQACRSDLNVAVIEKDRLGGLLQNANLVENYPIGSEPKPGIELVELFRKHLEQFDVNIIIDEIKNIVHKSTGEFVLSGNNGDYDAKSVVLAVGTLPKTPDIKGITNISEDRIFYEPKDMMPISEGKEYIVVGGGDAAFDYSLQLAGYKSKIIMIVRRSLPDCLPLLKKRVEKNSDSITVIYNSVVTNLEEDAGSGRLICTIRTGDDEGLLSADSLIIATGRSENDALLKQLSESSSVKLGNSLNEKTKIPGLYLAGDMVNSRYRQVGTAVGSGLKAAMMAAEYLAGVEQK